ncbi:acyl-CoA carboxylase subunit beta [Anaeromicropila herbilytica]|uniref:Methylmalonyl-CoA carboxyltransferase n=1 Tax=Anaeromicropila herbilytica TaxID=2785025 RepID=A0A7R7EM49_9FIRM|nr:carboxyl transferase domain-containing protein [Anaeromicropila herbilytica]BCN31332.1 methylmalonyl-CoA carboxyltransferase [Anaeromicropila herbilytica]
MNDTISITARARIDTLLDTNSFVEIGAFVTKRNTDYNLMEKEAPADGVITGYGTINQKLVYVYSQEPKILGGSIGEMHARKIQNLYDLALKTGAPIIGIIDCAGFRLQEATDALEGFGGVYLKQSIASGIIPQISVVCGMCGGGVAISTALTDFTYLSKNAAKLFVNPPNTLNFEHSVTYDTTTSEFREASGNADMVLDDESNLFVKVRELIDILPSNNSEGCTTEESTDDINRMIHNIEVNNDVKDLLYEVSDKQYFYEIKENYEKQMVIGFIKLNGRTIGVVANHRNEEKGDAFLSTEGCYKAERFVRFCDAFEIPLLTLTDVSGYLADSEEEKTIASAAAKLTYAFANATVPKINLIVGKAFGSAYLTMNSKHIGADIVFSYKDSKIGMMDSKIATSIIYEDEINASTDKLLYLDTKAGEYEEKQISPIAAAKRGYVDSIIEISSTRKELIYTFDMLYSKRETRPRKKHGTI